MPKLSVAHPKGSPMMSETLFELEPEAPSGWHSALCRCPYCRAVKNEPEPPQRAALDAKSEWHAAARAYVKSLPAGTLLTSEDITDVIGMPSGHVASNRNNAVGALMRSLSGKRLIHHDHYTKSKNPQAHGAVIAVWRVA